MAAKTPTLFKHTFNFNDNPFYVGRLSVKHAIKPQTTLQWLHTHPGLEIGGVVSGKGVQHFNGKQFPLKQGDVFVVDPVYFHEIIGTAELDLVVSHLTRESVIDAHLDKSNLSLMRPFAALQGGMPTVVSGMGACVAELVEAWELYNGISKLGRQRAFIAILGVISKIAQRTEEYTLEHRDEAWRKNHDLVSHATEYINARSCDDFSLDDLAEHCAVSKSRLCHAFRDFTGESPMALRGRIRISRAVDLLKSTDAKTSAIALECGFNDYAAFYRLCKKVTGLNPEDVRKGKG